MKTLMGRVLLERSSADKALAGPAMPLYECDSCGSLSIHPHPCSMCRRIEELTNRQDALSRAQREMRMGR